jgi:hypothetical protein
LVETPGTADWSRERHLTLRSPIHRLVICQWHSLAPHIDLRDTDMWCRCWTYKATQVWVGECLC